MIKEYPKLLSATPICDYRLQLVYSDGNVREYDFSQHLSHPFYAALSEAKLFELVYVENGDIYWPTGQDFCPNTLYEYSQPVQEAA
ncbi:MAG: DUF2442 domain-containing protein [Oscillospiraceae bacterium]|nr:DUF2442 domain-containing protein [Oscillospiraceae bacterium]